MNMESFQKFIEVHKTITNDIESPLYEKLIRNRIEELKKRIEYKDVQAEKIVLDEHRKIRRDNRDVSVYMESAQVYEIDDKHKFMLMLTKNPRFDEKELWNHVRLPFPEIFLDVKFDFDDRETEIGDRKIFGILLKEQKEITLLKKQDGIKHIIQYGLNAYVAGITIENQCWIDKYTFPITTTDDELKIKLRYDNVKEAHFIKNFVVNFLLFLKDREVEIVERKREYNPKREKLGKMPLPSSKIIKLTGTLKRYMDSVSEHSFRGKLSYSFWVSGHFRTLKSERYKSAKGKVLWIAPFRKGEGMEVKHIYRILPEDDKDTLDYEDIKETR